MEPASILMCVGKEHYALHEMLVEYKLMGPSKRIPLTTIPEGLIPLQSKIFISHPDAIIKVTAEGKTLADLAEAIQEFGAWEYQAYEGIAERLAEKPFWTGEELNAEDYVPDDMLFIAQAMSALPTAYRNGLVEKFELEFCMGVVGYSHFTEIQLVLPGGVDELPEDMQHLEPLIEAGVIKPVWVEYEEDNETKS